MPRPHDALTRRRATRAQRGRLAEGLAAWWLRLHGFSVLSCRQRFGGVEVDLVARRRRLVLVVEVKSRLAGRRCVPTSDLVSASQRERLGRAADAVGRRLRLPVRLDLIEVRWLPWPRITWHRGPWTS